MPLPKAICVIFADEVRYEVDSKLSLMGVYPLHKLVLLDPDKVPVDRIGIFFQATWVENDAPKSVKLKIELPGSEIMSMDISLAPRNESGAALVTSNDFIAISGINMRLPPLSRATNIKVFLDIDQNSIQIGQLNIE